MSSPLSILRAYWGYDDFRGIQREIIESICAGRDTLGLMPTGGGKSLTFQVPALMMSGVCLVVTPLVALMTDQVDALRRRGIKAAAVHSGMSHADIIATLENAIFGGVRLLYVSPERLSSELFLKKISHTRVSFIAVDEAHCISQWGYDFRPAYLRIADLRRLKPDAPVLALTATATPRVAADIQRRLGFAHDNVIRMSFRRDNLAYIVRRSEDKAADAIRLLAASSGSAIIYTRSRQRTREIAAALAAEGISAAYYNAALATADRDTRQRQWQSGQTRVMVATNAFGMGIDKADVRLVIHTDCPDSPEAYFQEAGRAGRDGLPAAAVLLYSGADRARLARRVSDTFPPPDYIRTVYEHLAYFYQIALGSGAGCRFEFNIDKFCHYFRHFPLPVVSALRLLHRAGYIVYDADRDNMSQLTMLVSRDTLGRLYDLTPDDRAVVTALLRTYGGLFSGYAFIDESLIALHTGLDRRRVYAILKSLTRRRIVQFVPRKQIPHIVYTRARCEAGAIVLPPEVYLHRRQDYAGRISAITAYAENDNICRSRLLLRYFGEDTTQDCHICDVCRKYEQGEETNGLSGSAQAAIEALLSDGKPHTMTELSAVHADKEALNEALQHLVSEEKIRILDGKVFKK